MTVTTNIISSNTTTTVGADLLITGTTVLPGYVTGTGIYINATNVTITNSHKIVGYSNKYYYTDSGITFHPTASGTTSTFKLINSGSITGYGGAFMERPFPSQTNQSAVYITNAGLGVMGPASANFTGRTANYGRPAIYMENIVGSATVVNSGQILGHTTGAKGVGIELATKLGAFVTNNVGGTITQGVAIGGHYLKSNNLTSAVTSVFGTVVNGGLITGAAGPGGVKASTDAIVRYENFMFPVYMSGGGQVTNLSGGTISPSGASMGIYLTGTVAGTVTNAGTIGGSGTATLSVKFAASTLADALVIMPTGQFGGNVVGGGTNSSIILGSSGSNGSITNLGGTVFSSFGHVSVASGAAWTLTSGDTFGAALPLYNAGTIFETGTLSPATMQGTGTIAFASGTSIVAVNSVVASSSNKFAGMTVGNTIEVIGATLVSATLQNTGTVLALPVSGCGTISLNLATSIASSNFFHVTTTGDNTFITENTTPCFLAGTRIRTDNGEVPVENLKIGDRVVTLGGTAQPIKWIGRRAYASAFAGGNRDIVPILIKQGALGRNSPVRDLYVSPLHAMFFDDVLVPAEHLVNGSSIVRCPEIDPIRYFHIELDQHDVIFAEGAPAETFVDCDSRAMFHNAAEFAEMYPGDRTQRWMFCAPRIESGPVLEQIKRGIDGRAGLAPAGAQVRPGPLHGNLDGLDGNSLTGWAFDPEHPDTPVILEVLDGAKLVARLTANRFRADLEAAGIGDGRHGFELQLARSLSPDVRHELRVRRVSDGKDLVGSPLAIEPHGRRDLVKDTRRTIEMAANTASDPGTMDALLDTLLQGVDRIRRLRATQQSEPGDSRLLVRPKPAAARPKRALVVDDLLPRQNRDAGSNAILSHMAALRALGWEIEFVASGELSRGDDAVAALKAWGVTCHRSPQISSVEEVLRRKRNMYDLVYLHRLSNTEAYAPLVRAWQNKARIVYSVADLHHVRTARQAQIHRTDELAEAAVLLKARELNAMRMVDKVITHSLAEAEYLSREAPGIQVHVVPWALQPMERSVSLANRQGIAFIGGMRHAPNPDAVRWLAAEIMPRVWARDPALECFLVGADWHAPVWGRIDPRIQLLGQVERLDTVFDKVRLTVAPVRFGAGIKGKVLDSFAAGVPCVMTPIAAEGIPLTGVLPSAVSDDPAVLADLILALHGEAERNAAHAADGLALVRAYYTEDAVAAALETVAGLGTPRAAVPLARAG